MKPADLHPSLSKFKSWRPYQKETIDHIVNSDKKFVVAELPAGSGKSLIAVASALITSKKTYITTYTKQLQDQYLKDFPEILTTIKGRNNYPCNYIDGLTAEDCLHNTKAISCPFRDSCPYLLAKERAKSSQITIFNNAYYLTALNYSDFPRAKLVIFDEAHLLENSLMNFIEIILSKRQLDKLDLPYPLPNENIFKYLTDLQTQIYEQTIITKEELKYATDVDDKDSIQTLSKKLRTLQSLSKKIDFLLTNLDSTWVIDYTPITTTFKPIIISNYNKYLFDHADRFVLMSATISKETAKLLGIDEDEIDYIKTPSPFPVENRPLIFIPKVNMSYKNQEKALPILIKLIDKVLEKHKDEKGIIHTSSNKLTQYIYNNSKYKDRLLIATGDSKATALSIHSKSKNTVLISPSMAEGVDLKYDEGRFQIIVNLPFPSLSDKQVKKRAEMDKNWYINQMANKLAQMYGRTNRAEDDYSITYIFDSRLLYYITKYKNHFPNWFLEAIKIIK